MNDRYLVRGKRLDNGEMIVGALCNGFWMGKTAKADKWQMQIDVGDSDYTVAFIDPATVGQCSGKSDKNGKLIFEGDILKQCTGLSDKNGKLINGSVVSVAIDLHIVTWHDGSFVCKNVNTNTLKPLTLLLNRLTLEIIGNIHDNPELLGATA